MPATTNSLLIAMFDAIGKGVTPTANFTPPTGFPLSSLADTQLFSRTRTPDLTANRQLTWDLGAATPFNVAMIAGTNATADTEYQLEAADDAGFTTGLVQSDPSGGPAFDTTLGHTIAVYVPPWGRTLIHVHATTLTKRYVRWRQWDPGNPEGYMEWGIARFGQGWQPADGFEADSHRVAPKYVGPKGAQRVLRGHELVVHMLTRAEAYDLEALCLTTLESRRVLMIPEPLHPETWLSQALWATLESVFVREPIAGMGYTGRRYRVQLTFREVDR